MTKEEREKAIAFLKDMQECTYDGVEEIRTAMECLSQEPCEDAVSRQAAIEALNCLISPTPESALNDMEYKYKKELHDLGMRVLHTQRKNIQALPPVTPAISEIDKFNDSVNRATVLSLINENADGFKDYSQYEYLFDQVDKMPAAVPTRKNGGV